MKDDQEFTLGLPTSRLAGSGGYLEAMGWTGQPDFVSAEPFRNLAAGLRPVPAPPSLRRPGTTGASSPPWTGNGCWPSSRDYMAREEGG